MDTVAKLSLVAGLILGFALGWFFCGALARYRAAKITVLERKLTEAHCSYDGVWLANMLLKNELARLKKRVGG